jgi:deoxycytidine triphosphate deaminase
MFGNLIANRQLKKLISSRVIEITPFHDENLSTVHLTICIGKVLQKLANGKIMTIHDFSENSNSYSIKGNEYIIVESYETIRLNSEKIVGHFIPVSTLIEAGLSLTAGKIDKRYGNYGPAQGYESEKIRFGLKNNTDCPFLLKPYYKIAHLELFDLSSVVTDEVQLSREDKLLRNERGARHARVVDDGPFYDEPDDLA